MGESASESGKGRVSQKKQQGRETIKERAVGVEDTKRRRDKVQRRKHARARERERVEVTLALRRLPVFPGYHSIRGDEAVVENGRRGPQRDRERERSRGGGEERAAQEP